MKSVTQPLLILTFVALFTCEASAQKQSSYIRLRQLEEVSKHIGDSVTLCASISQREVIDSTNTAILYLGGKYPHHLLKVTLQGPNDAKLWYGYMAGTVVYVAGRLVNTPGKPEMLITKLEQLGLCDKLD